jgi:hypothetical protein
MVSETHSFPSSCWPACVQHVVARGLSAADTREGVKRAKEFQADVAMEA